jgi:hypothetical protein
VLAACAFAFAAGALVAGAARPAAAQILFTKNTDLSNPVTADPGATANSYAGASWVDYDQDGLPDLFVCQRGLYRNLGGGTFAKVASAQPNQGLAIGCSWADYDNDGDPDLFVSSGIGTFTPGQHGSFLFRNDHPVGDATGAGPFTKITVGVLGDSLENGGWGCAWGDYDRDGRADVVVAGLPDFTARPSNHLLHNLGGGLFERDTTTAVDDDVAPFTVPTWADFDLDGDDDLFMSAGPANTTLGPDFVYRNGSIGGGTTALDRIVTFPFAANRDGQVWNWIDYDSDGDLDGHVTSYGAVLPGQPDELYRNDGAGGFHKLTGAEAGPIVTDALITLAGLWADFDNDGDLDCFVTNDPGTQRNRLYRNDVDSLGVFTAVTVNLLTTTGGPHYTACAADYDRDGDVDLFVNGTSTRKALYRNDTPGGLHWVEFTLVGDSSNRSAIGARIKIRSIVKGVPRWQQREVSAQDTFNGHGDFTQHFGLREGGVVDSLVIDWPSGLVEAATSLAVDRRHTIVEGSLSPVPVEWSLDEARIVDGDGEGGVAVELSWSGGLDGARFATVERSDRGAPWAAVAEVVADGAGRFRHRDDTVERGARYGYRLAVADGAEIVRVGAVWLDVPAGPNAPAIAFGVSSRTANPMRVGRALVFEVALGGGAERARLELFDVSGARIAQAEIDPAGDASALRSVRLEPARAPSPGVYWARLTQAGRSAARRIVLVR